MDKDNSTQDIAVYKNSVGKPVIEKIKHSSDLLTMYSEYRLLEKSVSTYGTKFLVNVNPVSNRIHCDFFQLQNTGRLSSNSPNLQNIPAREEFKSCFTVSDPKNVLIGADYSNQESRVLADVAQETVLIDFFKNGDGDLHSLTARGVFKEPVDGKKKINLHLRQKGKIINFTLNYGGGASKIASANEVPIAVAKRWVEDYFKLYPALKTYYTKKINTSINEGFVRIDKYTNRLFHLENFEEYVFLNKWVEYCVNAFGNNFVPKSIMSKLSKQRSEYERISMNYPIQGASGSMLKLACIYIQKQLKINKLEQRAFITNLIHDEILVECAEEVKDQVASIVKKCMELAATKFCKSIPVPASIVIGKYWTK